MRKCVGFLSVGLMLVVLNACDQSTVYSEPPENMVVIPAGEFMMGTASEQVNADQKPSHKVNLDAFYIDKHEVTNAQYEELQRFPNRFSLREERQVNFDEPFSFSVIEF